MINNENFIDYTQTIGYKKIVEQEGIPVGFEWIGNCHKSKSIPQSWHGPDYWFGRYFDANGKEWGNCMSVFRLIQVME